MKNAALCASISLVALLPIASATVGKEVEADGIQYLSVAQDETSCERAIASYLREKGLTVHEKMNGPGDLVLLLSFDGGNAPDYRLAIDTQQSATSDGRVTGRVAIVRLYTALRVPDCGRAETLSTINRYHHSRWAGRFGINPDDGEIEGLWAINLIDSSGRPDLVHDAMVRLGVSWQDLYPDVTRALYAK